jgi:hypothetical protein
MLCGCSGGSDSDKLQGTGAVRQEPYHRRPLGRGGGMINPYQREQLQSYPDSPNRPPRCDVPAAPRGLDIHTPPPPPLSCRCASTVLPLRRRPPCMVSSARRLGRALRCTRRWHTPPAGPARGGHAVPLRRRRRRLRSPFWWSGLRSLCVSGGVSMTEHGPGSLGLLICHACWLAAQEAPRSRGAVSAARASLTVRRPACLPACLRLAVVAAPASCVDGRD